MVVAVVQIDLSVPDSVQLPFHWIDAGGPSVEVTHYGNVPGVRSVAIKVYRLRHPFGGIAIRRSGSRRPGRMHQFKSTALIYHTFTPLRDATPSHRNGSARKKEQDQVPYRKGKFVKNEDFLLSSFQGFHEFRR